MSGKISKDANSIKRFPVKIFHFLKRNHFWLHIFGVIGIASSTLLIFNDYLDSSGSILFIFLFFFTLLVVVFLISAIIFEKKGRKISIWQSVKLILIISLILSFILALGLTVLMAVICFVEGWLGGQVWPMIFLMTFLLPLSLILVFLLPIHFLIRYFGQKKFLWFVGSVGIILFIVIAPRLNYSYYDVSFSDFTKCYFFVKEERRLPFLKYRITPWHVCAAPIFSSGKKNEMLVDLFKEEFSIEPSRSPWTNYIPLENVTPEQLDFQFDDRSELSGWDYNYWIVKIGNSEYFISSKGNGRFFKVDSQTLEYFGCDCYKDKDGFIYKNARVERLPEKCSHCKKPLKQ